MIAPLILACLGPCLSETPVATGDPATTQPEVVALGEPEPLPPDAMAGLPPLRRRFFFAPELGGTYLRLFDTPVQLFDFRVRLGGIGPHSLGWGMLDISRGQSEFGLASSLMVVGGGGAARIGRAHVGAGGRVGGIWFQRVTDDSFFGRAFFGLEGLVSVDLVEVEGDRALYLSAIPAFDQISGESMWSIAVHVGFRL